jgi:serine/threonine-protein kinase
VFHEALDLVGQARETFLAHACADDAELRAEVESLLASDAAAGGFGELPAPALLADDEPSATRHRLEPGARIGSYTIECFLAAGGMGEVYRARHDVLSRHVAIKTVSPGQMSDAATRRLMREARHAARLTHPNICAVHEVGEDAGIPYIVMEYVEGRPLGEILREDGIPLDEAIAIAVQLADAVAHAHAHGVVHRDLKASNMMLDAARRPVVLDFGLAKRLPTFEETRDSSTTGLGQVVGTLSHMAPEVLQGAPADERSDVWSLGVVLFELLTGALPFSGRTPFETCSAILSESPRWSGRRIPLALRLMLERCLMKQPAARYQHVVEVRDALDAVRRRRAWPLVGRLLVVTRWRTLAVVTGGLALVGVAIAAAPWLRDRVATPHLGRVSTLAFLPLTHDPRDSSAAVYASGMTDGLVAQLGELANVRILAPASAAHEAARSRTLAEAARRLRAEAVVEGRLRRVGDRVLVDLRLVEPSRGRVVWSDSYERSVAQVLALQGDVVRALATEVRLTIRRDSRERPSAARAVNPEAYEAYLRGRFEWNSRTRESLQRAVAQFQRAVDLDPTFAPAHAALADCYNQFGTVMVGTGSPAEFRPRAAAEAIKALQIDPSSPEAHATLGYVRHYDWQWADAESEFRRAIELDPNYPLARIWYANMLMSRQRWREAFEQAEIARQLDPYSLVVNTNVAWVLSASGRPADAVAQLRRTLALDSTYVQAHWRLVPALMRLHKVAAALDEARRVVRMTDSMPPALALLAELEARAGDSTSARLHLRRLLERARTEYVPPASLGGVYSALGDQARAVRYLKLAFAERSNAIAYGRLDRALAQRDTEYRRLAALADLR